MKKTFVSLFLASSAVRSAEIVTQAMKDTFKAKCPKLAEAFAKEDRRLQETASSEVPQDDSTKSEDSKEAEEKTVSTKNEASAEGSTAETEKSKNEKTATLCREGLGSECKKAYIAAGHGMKIAKGCNFRPPAASKDMDKEDYAVACFRTQGSKAAERKECIKDGVKAMGTDKAKREFVKKTKEASTLILDEVYDTCEANEDCVKAVREKAKKIASSDKDVGKILREFVHNAVKESLPDKDDSPGDKKAALNRAKDKAKSFVSDKITDVEQIEQLSRREVAHTLMKARMAGLNITTPAEKKAFRDEFIQELEDSELCPKHEKRKLIIRAALNMAVEAYEMEEDADASEDEAYAAAKAAFETISYGQFNSTLIQEKFVRMLENSGKTIEIRPIKAIDVTFTVDGISKGNPDPVFLKLEDVHEDVLVELRQNKSSSLSFTFEDVYNVTSITEDVYSDDRKVQTIIVSMERRIVVSGGTLEQVAEVAQLVKRDVAGKFDTVFGPRRLTEYRETDNGDASADQGEEDHAIDDEGLKAETDDTPSYTTAPAKTIDMDSSSPLGAVLSVAAGLFALLA